MSKQEERQLVAGYIKTIFGISTGKIRADYGDVHAVANSIAAFEIGPQMMADGLIKNPSGNYADREDFKVLSEFSCRIDGPEEAMNLAKEMSEQDIQEVLHCAESFFTDLINDPEVIPMTKDEKKKLFMKMLEGRRQ